MALDFANSVFVTSKHTVLLGMHLSHRRQVVSKATSVACYNPLGGKEGEGRPPTVLPRLQMRIYIYIYIYVYK